MTSKEFVAAIINEYDLARKPFREHENISRGRSRSISSITEDLFAYYLASNVQGIKILIDQHFRVGKKSFFPDIAIIMGKVVVHLIDVKQDFGWFRNLHEGINKFESEIEELRCARTGHVTNKFKDGERSPVYFSKDIKRDFVVVSSENMSAKQLNINTNSFSRSKYNNLYILTQGKHPNSYKIEACEKMNHVCINEDSFEDIISKIKIIVRQQGGVHAGSSDLFD